jgi:hypothetical protein
MKRSMVVILSIILMVGDVLPEIQGFMPDKTRNEQLYVFMKPGFKLLDASGKEVGIAFSWLWKTVGDDFNFILIYFVMAMMARNERLLFYVISVRFFYHIIDPVLLIWNFKQTYEIYWFLLLTSILCICFILKEPKMKMVK